MAHAARGLKDPVVNTAVLQSTVRSAHCAQLRSRSKGGTLAVAGGGSTCRGNSLFLGRTYRELRWHQGTVIVALLNERHSARVGRAGDGRSLTGKNATKNSLLLLHMNYISLGPKQSLFVSSVLKEGWAMHCKGRDLSEWVEECDLWDCPQLSPVVADRACLFSPQGKTFPLTAQHSQLIFANPMHSIRYKITLTIQQGCFLLKNFPLSCII